jgi:hypothetical protein
MSLISSAANYGGVAPSTTAFVKQFYISPSALFNIGRWVNKTINGMLYITPANTSTGVYINQNLYVGGSITNPSDMKLKENVVPLSDEYCDNILKITPIQYNLKKDPTKTNFLGVSAQELEEYFPELVVNNTNNGAQKESFKSIKYLELIPILITKIQNMQKKIDDLELKINGSST